MPDRDKVIKEFELFIKEFHPACTSDGVELDMFREVLSLLEEQEDLGTELTNAVELIRKKNERIKELLKKQEPRILDWDEIRNYPVVYGEFRGVKDIYPLIITIDSWGRCLSWNPGINISKEFILLVSDEEDRKNTRCWDKMPTEEQRKAVKWE